MIIALPVTEPDDTALVNGNFGRTPFFLITNSEFKEKTYVENQSAQSQGGAGVQASQLMVDSNVNVVLVPRCGEKAAQVLKKADIKAFKTNGTDIQAAIDAFNANQLEQLF